jgi:site-specific DNA-methyltransferase (cytosine-N4-specific)
MPELDDESVAAIITSPPYPMIEKWDACFASQKAKTWLDQIRMIIAVLKEGIRVLIPGGIICLNIGDATRTMDGNFGCYPNYAALAFLLTIETEMVPLIPVLWKKISNRPNAFLGSGFLPVNAYVSQDFEYIGIFRKGKLRQFNGDEKARRQRSRFTKEERDLWFQQVWNINGKRNAKKDSGWPQEVPYRLMRMFTIEGDTILDPFCGPGDEELYNKYGRNFVGYEIGE